VALEYLRISAPKVTFVLPAYEEMATRACWRRSSQVRKDHVHADKGECRNIGDAREFIRLFQYTGEPEYLDQALRLFRELRTKLSTGDLFDQGGKPLAAELPFIDDDEAGLHIGYAKPYIIGYALTGLPEGTGVQPALARAAVRAANGTEPPAARADALGLLAWPHPRSSYLILSQAIEHAWQLVRPTVCWGEGKPPRRHRTRPSAHPWLAAHPSPV
jgi:hypothetical protein